MDQTTNMELSQKQKHQLHSRLDVNLENERDNSEDEYYSNDEEEDPTPQWNIPNWKGNAKDVVEEQTCTGCVTRISKCGVNRGCMECDPEFWDMPDLEDPFVGDEYEIDDFYDKPDDPGLAERIYMQHELEGEFEDESPSVYCEGV